MRQQVKMDLFFAVYPPSYSSIRGPFPPVAVLAGTVQMQKKAKEAKFMMNLVAQKQNRCLQSRQLAHTLARTSFTCAKACVQYMRINSYTCTSECLV